MTRDSDDAPALAAGPSRRLVAQSFGWSAPLIVAAVSAPAAQASTPPPTAFEGLVGTWSTPVLDGGLVEAEFTVTNTATETLVVNEMVFTASDPDAARPIVAGGPRDFLCFVGPSSAAVGGDGRYEPGQSLVFTCVLGRRNADRTEVTVVAYESAVPTAFAVLVLPPGF